MGGQGLDLQLSYMPLKRNQTHDPQCMGDALTTVHTHQGLFLYLRKERKTCLQGPAGGLHGVLFLRESVEGRTSKVSTTLAEFSKAGELPRGVRRSERLASARPRTFGDVDGKVNLEKCCWKTLGTMEHWQRLTLAKLTQVFSVLGFNKLG